MTQEEFDRRVDETLALAVMTQEEFDLRAAERSDADA